MHVSVLLATLVICVTSSNITVSPILHLTSLPPFSSPVFVLQNVVPPLGNAPPVKASVTPNFPVAKYYGDVFAPTLRCESSVPKIKAKKIVKVTTKTSSASPTTSVLNDSISDNRDFALNITARPALRSDFNLGTFLDTSFVVFCFVFLFNTSIVLLITLLLELNCDIINENDLDDIFEEPFVPMSLVPKQNKHKSVRFNVPARHQSTANATMHKAIKVQLNLDFCSVPVICLPKLPTLFENEKLTERAAELNNKVLSPKPVERYPIAGAFNASIINAIKSSIEKRVCRMNAMKTNTSTNVKQTAVAIRNITRSTKHNSSDC